MNDWIEQVATWNENIKRYSIRISCSCVSDLKMGFLYALSVALSRNKSDVRER